MNNKYDCDFFIEHPYYKLVINMQTKNKFIMFVLDKAIKAQRLNIKAKEKLSEINEIYIDNKYYNLIKTSVQKLINKEFETAKNNGVYIKSNKVGSALFRRNKKNINLWDIEINIVGEYSGIK